MSRPLLITIGVSHYCEKARWALDRAGIAFDEEAHAPMAHWAFTLPRTRTKTVPILLAGDEKLTDSRDILRFCDRDLPDDQRLYPSSAEMRDEVTALSARFDDELGPATRRFAYAHLVDEPALFVRVVTQGVSGPEVAIVDALGRGMRAIMRRGFRLGPGVADRMFTRITSIFDDVGAKLQSGRRYIAGDRFSAADLTFASLAGPILQAGKDLSSFPRAYADRAEALRSTVAGRHAVRLSLEERHTSVRPSH